MSSWLFGLPGADLASDLRHRTDAALLVPWQADWDAQALVAHVARRYEPDRHLELVVTGIRRCADPAALLGVLVAWASGRGVSAYCTMHGSVEVHFESVHATSSLSPGEAFPRGCMDVFCSLFDVRLVPGGWA